MTNPPPTKRSKTGHDPSPIQVSFTLPSSQTQQQFNEDADSDRRTLEREKLQLDRERLEMEKEKRKMEKEKHAMKQKLRRAKLHKLQSETSLAKAATAAAKFKVFKGVLELHQSGEESSKLFKLFDDIAEDA